MTDPARRARWLLVQDLMRNCGWTRRRAERWVDTQLADREEPGR